MSLATEKEFKNIHEFIERRLGGRKPVSLSGDWAVGNRCPTKN